MKICLINNLYKPYNRGGAERITEIIFKGLQDAGNAVFVISSIPRFVKKEKEENIFRVKSFYWDLGKMPKIFRIFWHFWDMFDFVTCLKINSIIKREKPDIVITHNLKGISFLVPWVIKKNKIKHIHFLHDVQLFYPSGLIIYGQEKRTLNFIVKIYYSICRYLFKDVSVVISPSKWLLNEHARRGFFKKSDKMVLPNPAPELRIVDKGTSDEFVILYVGLIERHKGIFLLIDAFKKIYQELGDKKIKLEIIGSGGEEKKLLDEIRENENIIYKNKLNNAEVGEVMSMSTLLVVPSICYENSPTVIYEAVGSGLPVLASEIGGIVDLIKDLGGFLFEPGNEDELIRNIKRIIKNPQELEDVKKRGRDKINNYYQKKYLDNLMKKIF